HSLAALDSGMILLPYDIPSLVSAYKGNIRLTIFIPFGEFFNSWAFHNTIVIVPTKLHLFFQTVSPTRPTFALLAMKSFAQTPAFCRPTQKKSAATLTSNSGTSLCLTKNPFSLKRNFQPNRTKNLKV
ncbi:MAG: hypothetical protein IJ588_14210, partial [Prevotella sp.]|nr:hypothetical protein [Prevotella sp.]